MRLLGNMLCGITLAGLVISGVWAQSTYSPGQTFSSSPSGTPAAAAPVQPRPEVNLPVYAPVQQRPVQAVPPQSQQVQRTQVQPSQLYNMPRTEATPAVRREASKTNKSRTASESAPAKREVTSKSTSDNAEKEEARTEKAQEAKEPVKQDAKAEPEETATEEAEASAAAEEEPVKPASNDKLVFTDHKTGQKLIALTYDDGPNPSMTPRLAEYLKANDVAATFYVCGNMVKQYPDLVKQLAADGFELANHSYDHPNLQKLSRDKVLKQLQDTHDLIKEHAGVDVKTMRPPYGAMNSTVKEVCETMGYKIILWDVDTEDWRKPSTAKMMSTISKLTGDGSIILMHDRKHAGKDTVLETTQQTVEKYRAQGYRFVTVTELLGLSNGSTVAESVPGPVVPGPVVPGPVVPGPVVPRAADVSTTASSTVLGQSLPSPNDSTSIQ